MKIFNMIYLGLFAFSTILMSCHGHANIQNDTILDVETWKGQVIELLRPYQKPIRSWFWELSGMSYKNPYAQFSTSSEIEPQADYITCEICRLALPAVRLVFVIIPDITTEIIIDVITAVCELLDLAPDPTICRPTIESYAVSVLYIIQNKPDLPDVDFCGIINIGCGEINEDLRNWKITINNDKPALVPRPPPPPEDQDLVKILQFTDLHLDLDYEEGTNAACSMPACCREGEPADVPSTAGKWGHYGCEMPTAALDALYNEAKTNHGDATFIFLTGDYIHSGVWLYGIEENTRHIRAVTERLLEAFPNAEIFPLTGNHETDVVNMYTSEGAWPDLGNLTWMYDAVAIPFASVIPTDQLDLFRKYGYYTMLTKADPKLRIVTLNTNICYINNFWLPYDPIDTNGQLQWFAGVMDAAEKAGEKVYLLGHIHPGSGSCWPVWSNQFTRVIARYEGILKGQWYGHSHEQDYKLSFEPWTDRPISVHYLGGSGVTDGMNSAFNVYYADGKRGDESTWEIINQETWILNLTASNAQAKEQPPIFQKVLNAKEDFGFTMISPEEVFALVYRMVCDDELLLTYQKSVVKGTEDTNRFRPCRKDDLRCKAGVLGNLFVSNSGDLSNRNKLEDYIYTVDCTKVTAPPTTIPTGTPTITTPTASEPTTLYNGSNRLNIPLYLFFILVLFYCCI